MHDAKAILFTIVNDCQTFFDEYFYNGVIVGAGLVSLYCIIFLWKFICIRNITRSNFFNACMKIPFVALLGFYCYLVVGITLLSRNKGAVYILWTPFRKPGWSLLVGFLCSLSIECIQLFTWLGKFETDDIMNNMFGVMIGFLVCKVVVLILKTLRN